MQDAAGVDSGRVMRTDFREWPDDLVNLSRKDLVRAYSDGNEGVVVEPEQDDILLDAMNWKTWADAASDFGTAGDGEGKLSTPWKFATKYAPRTFPGPAQTVGDCVSRAIANAATVSMFVEIELGFRDEESGFPESYDPVPDDSQGVLATEHIYGMRGHTRSGASVSRLITAVQKTSGLLQRRVHQVPEMGQVNLTEYDGLKGQRWGPATPSCLSSYACEHQVREVTEIESVEECRDAIANGYGVVVGSDVAFGSRRDIHGVCRTSSGRWSHCMAFIGSLDDPSDPACREHGRPLLLCQNSWGRSVSGNGTHGQPDGSWWVRPRAAASMIRAGSCYALSSVSGWYKRELPDFGATGVI